MQTSEQQARQFADSGLVDSGGGLNQFTSNLVRVALEGGGQKEYLDSLRRAYKQRVDAMDAALHKHIGDRAAWTVPTGGFFFWLTCSDDFLAAANRSTAAGTPGQFNTTALLDATAAPKSASYPAPVAPASAPSTTASASASPTTPSPKSRKASAASAASSTPSSKPREYTSNCRGTPCGCPGRCPLYKTSHHAEIIHTNDSILALHPVPEPADHFSRVYHAHLLPNRDS